MRILLVTQYYPPEVGAAQNRLSGLAMSLKEAGHTVTILTALPNYPKGAIYDDYKKHLFLTEVKDGVTIVRTWLYTRQNLQFFRRLAHYFSFSAMALMVSIFKVGRQDIVLTESPPLFAGIVGWLISKIKRAKFALNISDLWTDSAVEIGMLRNTTLISMALRGEKFLYRHAHLITGQTQGIVDCIRSRMPGSPVALMTNGVDQEFFIRTGELRTSDRRAEPISSKKFIVGFAGLHGHMQDLETVIEAARLLRNNEHICFVFYGDGPKKQKLVNMVQEGQIKNVAFSPPQPANRMPEIFSSFDAMLIPLKNLPILKGAIPCKMLEAMAAAVPILLLAEGEAKSVIQQADCGIAVAPENAKLLADAILELYNNESLRRRLGQSGRQYALKHYDRRSINKRFEGLLLNVFRNKKITIPETFTDAWTDHTCG